MLRRTLWAVLGCTIAQSAIACTCAQPPGLCDRLRAPGLSGLVFVGTVTHPGLATELMEKFRSQLTPEEWELYNNDEFDIKEARDRYVRLFPASARSRVLSARNEDEFTAVLTEFFPFLNDSKQLVKFKVSEMLIGEPSESREIWTSVSSCGVSFQRGHRYVVFADLDEETGCYATRACGGTFEPEGDNNKRLNYLRAVRQGAIPAELVSVVATGGKPGSRMSGVKITVDSASTHQVAETNRDGEAGFASLFAGRYTLSASYPGLQFPGLPRTIELGAGCTILDIASK